MNTLNNAGLFLINTLFNLYLFVLTIRFILAYARANYFNPITQLIVKITQPLVAPVRRLIPNYRNIELATLIWIIIFEIVKILILIALTIRIFSTVEIIWLVSSDTLKLFLSTFFYAILF